MSEHISSLSSDEYNADQRRSAIDTHAHRANAAQLFVRCLENEGVRYIFGVPGEENEDFLFALEDSSITFVPARHEQGAAFMADVWGRLTGDAGVCLSTLGPGATNLLTGVADANLDKAPLVAITAQGDRDRLHHESHQALDVVAMFRPVTKWNAQVAEALVVPETVRKAFKLAEQEKPGATHLELPENVAAEDAAPGSEPLRPRTVRRPAPDSSALERAAELVAGAERPLVLAGNGAIRQRASRRLTELVQRFELPVAQTFMGKGAVSDRLPQSLLTVGQGFRDYVAEAFETSDLVLAVGYDVAEIDPASWNSAGDRTIVHLDFEPAEVYAAYDPTVEVVGDVSEGLHRLDERLQSAGAAWDPAWYRPIRERIFADLDAYPLAEEAPFTVPAVLRSLRAALGDDGLVISDVGTHKMWLARNFPTYCPNGCLISNGLASMGIALPGAVAAALVDPGRPVVAVNGDGGFLMNVQELETARRLHLAFVVLVLRDDDYGLIRWKQQLSTGKSTGTRISNPDLVSLAESFGIEGYRPRTAEELESCLRDAVGSDRLCLIDVEIDVGANDRLIDKLETYWSDRP